MIFHNNGTRFLPTIENGIVLDFDTPESRSIRGFRYTINLNHIKIDFVTKSVSATYLEYVKIYTNAIVDCWRISSTVDMRKRM